MLRSTGERGSALARNSSGLCRPVAVAGTGGGQTGDTGRGAGRREEGGYIIEEKYVSNVTISNMWPQPSGSD